MIIRTPVAYIGTVAVLTFLFPKAGSSVEWMLYSLFGGGLMLGAFFMATDYATSPVTKKGQLIFGHRLRPVHRVYPLFWLL